MISGMDASRTIKSAPKVLLAGHAQERCRSLRAVLEADGMTVCDPVADLAGAVAASARERPDLCLLDAGAAGAGYAGVEAILGAAPGVHVVITDGSASDAELLEAVAVGASGHLRRDLHAAALTGALRDVLAGRSAFPRRLEPLVAAALRAPR